MRDPFFTWLIALLGLAVVAVGILFGLAALGLLHQPVVGWFVGIGLGLLCLLLCLFGAFVVVELVDR